jgi:transposase-like protein
MTTLILATTDKARENILESMEEKTRHLAVEGGSKLKNLHTAGILLYYELGEMINDLSTDETIDGDGEITKLAQYWGIDNTNKLYEWRNTAMTFDKAFLAAQARVPLPNGREITFEHFKALRRVEDPSTREKLLKQVRKDSWSASDLASEIRATGSVKTKRQGGRNPSIPTTAASMVQKCFTQAQQLQRYLVAVSPEVDQKFEEIPADEATEKLLETIDSTSAVLDTVKEYIADFHESLDTARERVVTIMDNTENQAATAVETTSSTNMYEDAEAIYSTAVRAEREAMDSPSPSVEELRARTVKTVVKKKRGRPKGSTNNASEGGATLVKKKRGRPRGSKNKNTSTD